MPRWSGELRTRLESLREVLLIAQNRMSYILVLVHFLRNDLEGRLANVRCPIDLCRPRIHRRTRVYEWALQDTESLPMDRRTCGALHGRG